MAINAWVSHFREKDPFSVLNRRGSCPGPGDEEWALHLSAPERKIISFHHTLSRESS